MPATRYFVADVDRSVAFYAKLGFVEKERWGPAFVIVTKDGHDLWLSGPGTSAAKPMPDGQVPAPGGWNRVVVEVEGLSELVVALRAEGVAFRNELLSGPGGTQILAEDPDGNPIELFEAR